MSCKHCKEKEAYLYYYEDNIECEIFRIKNYLYFKYIDINGQIDKHVIEIIYCPWCGDKLEYN